MKNLENNTTENVATPTTKVAKKIQPKKVAPKAKVEKIEVEKNDAPKETTPKVSKFEKITSEFCEQNKIEKVQLFEYLLKKSGKKVSLIGTRDEVESNI